MGGVVGAVAPAGGPHFQVEWASWVSSRGYCPHQLEVVKALSDGAGIRNHLFGFLEVQCTRGPGFIFAHVLLLSGSIVQWRNWFKEN